MCFILGDVVLVLMEYVKSRNTLLHVLFYPALVAVQDIYGGRVCKRSKSDRFYQSKIGAWSPAWLNFISLSPPRRDCVLIIERSRPGELSRLGLTGPVWTRLANCKELWEIMWTLIEMEILMLLIRPMAQC